MMRGPNEFLKPLDQAGKDLAQRIVTKIETEFSDGMTFRVEFDVTDSTKFPSALVSVWKEVLRQAREAGWVVTRTDGHVVIKYPDEI